MTDGPAGGLEVVMEAAAGELAAVDRQEGPGGPEWSTGGIVFASVSGNRAEFRLTPAVAAAALRTPDTERSGRGADWVAFAPVQLDGHAVDRAEAWLASAWRRAGAKD